MVCPSKKTNLVNYLNDNKAPKRGNKEELVKQYLLQKNLLLRGRSNLLNMNTQELEIKTDIMCM